MKKILWIVLIILMLFVQDVFTTELQSQYSIKKTNYTNTRIFKKTDNLDKQIYTAFKNVFIKKFEKIQGYDKKLIYVNKIYTKVLKAIYMIEEKKKWKNDIILTKVHNWLIDIKFYLQILKKELWRKIEDRIIQNEQKNETVIVNDFDVKKYINAWDKQVDKELFELQKKMYTNMIDILDINNIRNIIKNITEEKNNSISSKQINWNVWLYYSNQNIANIELKDLILRNDKDKRYVWWEISFNLNNNFYLINSIPNSKWSLSNNIKFEIYNKLNDFYIKINSLKLDQNISKLFKWWIEKLYNFNSKYWFLNINLNDNWNVTKHKNFTDLITDKKIKNIIEWLWKYPLFTTSIKTNDMYLLIPTTYFCSMITMVWCNTQQYYEKFLINYLKSPFKLYYKKDYNSHVFLMLWLNNNNAFKVILSDEWKIKLIDILYKKNDYVENSVDLKLYYQADKNWKPLLAKWKIYLKEKNNNIRNINLNYEVKKWLSLNSNLQIYNINHWMWDIYWFKNKFDLVVNNSVGYIKFDHIMYVDDDWNKQAHIYFDYNKTTWKTNITINSVDWNIDIKWKWILKDGKNNFELTWYIGGFYGIKLNIKDKYISHDQYNHKLSFDVMMKQMWMTRIFWFDVNLYIKNLVNRSILLPVKFKKIDNLSEYFLSDAYKNSRDIARKANLSQIGIALEMYFNDYWLYPFPEKLKLNLSQYYISVIPTDPKTKKQYFYYPLTKNWADQGWAILWAQMENPKNCNLNVTSDQELLELLKKYDYKREKINQLLDYEHKQKFNEGCYYIMIN